jgi:hypothetical protein
MKNCFPFFQQASKRQNMACVGSDDPRPTALPPGFRSKKRMLTIFLDFSEPLVVDVMPQKCTMTVAYYAEVVLPQLSAALEERRPVVKQLHCRVARQCQQPWNSSSSNCNKTSFLSSAIISVDEL